MQAQSPLLIKPLLSDVTLSEIHAIMTGGFATMGGAIIAVYIAFGVSTQSSSAIFLNLLV